MLESREVTAIPKGSRYVTVPEPQHLVFVPFGGNRIYDHARIDMYRPATMHPVAFCESIYREAARIAASQSTDWPSGHAELETLFVRPNAFAGDASDTDTMRFLDEARTHIRKVANTLFNQETVYEFIPTKDIEAVPFTQDTVFEPIEFYAPGDNATEGWAMGGTPMALIDALELGVAVLDSVPI